MQLFFLTFPCSFYKVSLFLLCVLLLVFVHFEAYSCGGFASTPPHSLLSSTTRARTLALLRSHVSVAFVSLSLLLLVSWLQPSCFCNFIFCTFADWARLASKINCLFLMFVIYLHTSPNNIVFKCLWNGPCAHNYFCPSASPLTFATVLEVWTLRVADSVWHILMEVVSVVHGAGWLPHAPVNGLLSVWADDWDSPGNRTYSMC